MANSRSLRGSTTRKAGLGVISRTCTHSLGPVIPSANPGAHKHCSRVAQACWEALAWAEAQHGSWEETQSQRALLVRWERIEEAQAAGMSSLPLIYPSASTQCLGRWRLRVCGVARCRRMLGVMVDERVKVALRRSKQQASPAASTQPTTAPPSSAASPASPLPACLTVQSAAVAARAC